MAEKKTYPEIEEVKNQILNLSLIFASIIGFAAYFLSLTRYSKTGFELSFITDLFVMIIILSITIFRKKIGVKLKSYILIVSIFVLFIVDVYHLGVFSANKVLIVLLPFFSALAITLRKSIAIFIIAVTSFFILSYFHLSGILNAPPQNDIHLSAWIINILLIIVVTIVIIIVQNKFNQTHINLISDLEKRNTQLKLYRNNLEELVDTKTKQLKQANEELSVTNEDLVYQKEELIAALDSLKIMQERLVQSEKMASLGILAAGVSHEINNPLNFIQGGLLGLENYFNEELKSSKEDIEPFLNGIRVGVNRASNIVTSLNHYSRKDSSKTKKCDLHEIIEDSLLMLHNKIKANIEVKKDFTKENSKILCNKGQLQQVFMNILLNSAQAISNNGLINIITKIENNAIKIIFRDNGCGINQENINKIFDPFFTTKEAGEGTGLGMSVSLKIIEDHNGKIEYKSEINKGTEVTITLAIIT